MKMFLIALFVLSVGAFAQDADDIRIMNMMNNLRREHGAKPLKFHPKLDSIANEWVKEISDSLKNLSNEEIGLRQSQNNSYLHINLKKRALRSKLAKGLLCLTISENVAFSYGGIPDNFAMHSFKAWKNSPAHYRGMIKESDNYFGYSKLADSNGRVLYITVFANVIE